VAWIERYRNPHGVRRIEGAKLFFPEEMPRIIVEEAMALRKMSLLRRNLDEAVGKTKGESGAKALWP
jgi:hypothetical protein